MINITCDNSNIILNHNDNCFTINKTIAENNISHSIFKEDINYSMLLTYIKNKMINIKENDDIYTISSHDDSIVVVIHVKQMLKINNSIRNQTIELKLDGDNIIFLWAKYY